VKINLTCCCGSAAVFEGASNFAVAVDVDKWQQRHQQCLSRRRLPLGDNPTIRMYLDDEGREMGHESTVQLELRLAAEAELAQAKELLREWCETWAYCGGEDNDAMADKVRAFLAKNDSSLLG